MKKNISKNINQNVVIEYVSDLAFFHYKSVEVSEKSYKIIIIMRICTEYL